jgi:hypothetical protein
MPDSDDLGSVKDARFRQDVWHREDGEAPRQPPGGPPNPLAPTRSCARTSRLTQ